MKDGWRPRFLYPLDPFLKKKKLDWAGAKLEETQAKAVLDLHKDKAAAIQGEIEEIEQSLRQSCEPGALIDRDRQRNMANYLKHTQSGLKAARQQVDDADKAHEQISREASAINQGIKALEKHRSGKQAEHAQEARRREYNQLDELWLSKANPANGGAAANISTTKNPRASRPLGKGGKNGS